MDLSILTISEKIEYLTTQGVGCGDILEKIAEIDPGFLEWVLDEEIEGVVSEV